MPWTVVIHHAARNALSRLDRPTRQRIAEKIQALGDDPDDPTLDVKPLAGRVGFRLRVGNWRIMFSREDDIQVIAIDQIRSRGDAYK